MEFNLTNEQKKRMLEDSKNAAHSELYLILIKMGIDPEAYSLDDVIETDAKYAGERYRFDGLVATLKNIEEKLAELQ